MFDTETSLPMLVIGSLFLLMSMAISASLIHEARQFVRKLHAPRINDPIEPAPRVLGILCLKGADPFLPLCLQRLAQQDYSQFSLRIVVDSAADPVWPTVRKFVEANSGLPVEIVTLQEPLTTCTRKMSSLLLGTSDIPADVEFVVLLDADMVAPSDLVRRLIAPLQHDARIAATSANRWYNPDHPTVASVLRYQWNSFCVTMMERLELMWAGACGMRAKDWRSTHLRNEIAHCFCEDQLFSHILPKGYGRVQLLPGLMIVNREVCTLPQMFNFIQRQLLAVYLQNPRWSVIRNQFLAVSVVCLAALVSWPVAELQPWIVAGLALLILTAQFRIQYLEGNVRRSLSTESYPDQQWPWWRSSTPTLLLTGLFHSCALISVLVTRTHRWRGVNYHVAKGPIVRLLEENVIQDGARRPTTNPAGGVMKTKPSESQSLR